MNGLDPESRALLSAAAGCHEPTESDRNRVRRRLAVRLGVAAGLGTLASVATKTGSAMAATAGSATAEATAFGTLLGSAKLFAISKIVGVALVTSAVSYGGYRVVAAHGAPQVQGAPAMKMHGGDKAGLPRAAATRAQASAAVASEELALPALAASVNTELPAPGISKMRNVERAVADTSAGLQQRAQAETQTDREATALPPVATFPSDVPGLSAEARGLALAQSALREGRPEQALAILDQQKSQFANGSLDEERAAARVLALCKMGQIQASKTAAAEFLRKSPHSVLAERVASACSSRP